MSEQQHQRLAENEAAFRSHNAAIATAVVEHGPSDQPFAFMCECAGAECTEMLRLTLDEFAHVRSHPARFFLAPGHVVPEVEIVVARHDQYWVVEKVGAAGEVAERHAGQER